MNEYAHYIFLGNDKIKYIFLFRLVSKHKKKHDHYILGDRGPCNRFDRFFLVEATDIFV